MPFETKKKITITNNDIFIYSSVFNFIPAFGSVILSICFNATVFRSCGVSLFRYQLHIHIIISFQ